MLIKARDILGLKVIAVNNGKKIENVDDVVYNPKENKIRALLVDKGGWMSSAKVIMFEDIKSIGQDAVMIESESVIKRAKEVEDTVEHIVKDDTYLTKTNVITEQGTELGRVSDVLFDSNSGEVVEFEVSQGLKNLKSGKKRFKMTDIITIGKDNTIVKTYTEEKFEQQAQTQGIQGAFVDAKENAPDMLNKAKEKIQESATTAKEKAVDLKDATKEKYTEAKENPDNQAKLESMKEKVASGTAAIKRTGQDMASAGKEKLSEGKDKVQDERKRMALGKYVKVNIVGADDTLLAPRGSIITNELLDEAAENGMLEQVLSNVTTEPFKSPARPEGDTTPYKTR